MNVEYLSDHVGDLIREARHKLRLLEDEQAYWESEIGQAEHDLTEARGRQPFLRRLLNLPTTAEPRLQNLIVEAERAVRSIVGGISEVERKIGVLEGGAEGEKRFEGELKWLSDDWTMFRGYSNQRGEVDAVLVGPDGIWTIEVKNWKASLRIDGDRWERRDAFSGASKRCTDRKGRTPGRQVGDIAESLAARLRRVGHRAPVRTAVVVLNDHARIESCRRVEVDFVGTSSSVFADRVLQLATPLAAPDVARIQQLVRDDHRYWERKAEIKRA